MSKQQPYVSKQADDSGFIAYDEVEDQTWAKLYRQQENLIPKFACKEYIKGQELLALPKERNPQLEEVSERLRACTGWSVAPVPALISYDRFFNLLANKQFPAATFIRRPQDMEYLEEPDIFHEIFGHCPMLTDQVYADFMEAYGKIGVDASDKDQTMLARLYWFTVEFGLIKQSNQYKAYGAGILSSIGETTYAIESDVPERRPFDIVDVFRTPYRIDIFQTVYYVIENYEMLYDVVNQDLFKAIGQARAHGMFEPTYPPKEKA